MTRPIPYGIITKNDWSEEYMPPLTEAQKKAKAKYNSKVTKVSIEFYPSDAELLAKVQAQENKQAYLKDLIRKDLK